MIATPTFSSATWPYCFGEKEHQAPSSTTDPQRSAAKGKQGRVLVVDDERLIADSVAEILNSRGYEVVACYDGERAIEAARNRCSDLVLSDVIMPRLNGVDTVIAIQEICPATRILVFSGQARTNDLPCPRAPKVTLSNC